jgi:hypothetical protein
MIITFLQGGTGAINQLFGENPPAIGIPGALWYDIIPTNAYWSNFLRNYLSGKIHKLSDLKNIIKFTPYFIHENLYKISGGKYENLATGLNDQEWQNMQNKFIDILISERQGNIVQEVKEIKTYDIPYIKGSYTNGGAEKVYTNTQTQYDPITGKPTQTTQAAIVPTEITQLLSNIPDWVKAVGIGVTTLFVANKLMKRR